MPPPEDDFDGGGDEAEDLGWMTAQAPSEVVVLPHWAHSQGSSSELARHTTPASMGLLVQVQLEGGWRDISAGEMEQFMAHLQAGERSFSIKARGQDYLIDLTGATGKQTNAATAKSRNLRIVEKSGEEDDFPDRDDSAQGASKRDVPQKVKEQAGYGPQSLRGGAPQTPLDRLGTNEHALSVFHNFAANERRMCGEWAVFYHSYSFAALIYEVHAAVGAVLFRFRSKYATLPRILVHEFRHLGDSAALMKRFNEQFYKDKRDHHPLYRAVGISVMCSLVATGPEACPPIVFVSGYSCKDVSFRGVLENLLVSCYVPQGKVKKLADDIIALSEKHGLDVSQFGGRPCTSGQAGHLLQIFIKRDLVDKLCYAAKPYGPVDDERMPLSAWMNSPESKQVGQARIVAHPKYFLRANCVRQFVSSADPTFHRNRAAFQEELTQLLGVILGAPDLRERAATGIYGGVLPAWWTAEDQRKAA